MWGRLPAQAHVHQYCIVFILKKKNYGDRIFYNSPDPLLLKRFIFLQTIKQLTIGIQCIQYVVYILYSIVQCIFYSRSTAFRLETYKVIRSMKNKIKNYHRSLANKMSSFKAEDQSTLSFTTLDDRVKSHLLLFLSYLKKNSGGTVRVENEFDFKMK